MTHPTGSHAVKKSDGHWSVTEVHIVPGGEYIYVFGEDYSVELMRVEVGRNLST